MITKEKIEIDNRYGGDVDAFVYATKKQKKIMSDNDFFIIRTLTQNIHIIRNGLASKEFEQGVDKTLREECASEEVIEQLRNLRLIFL